MKKGLNTLAAVIFALGLTLTSCGVEPAAVEVNDAEAKIENVQEGEKKACEETSKEECAKKCAESEKACEGMSKEECAKKCADKDKACEGMSKEECAKKCEEKKEETVK